MTRFFLSILIGLLTVSAQAASEYCDSIRDGWSSYRWCANFENGSKSGTVIYYFHGNGGNEKGWITPEHQQIVQSWIGNKKQIPTVVTVSFGSSWFLNSSLKKIFFTKMMRGIEGKLGLKPTERVLMGESMGGFNATAALEYANVFSRVAILCPAIYNISPYASNSEIQNFVASQPSYVAGNFIVKWLGKQRDSFSASEWATKNPLAIADSFSSTNTSLYVLGDEKDPLGFFPGSQTLVKKLKARNARLQVWNIPGGAHCQHSAESLSALAKFLVP